MFLYSLHVSSDRGRAYSDGINCPRGEVAYFLNRRRLRVRSPPEILVYGYFHALFRQMRHVIGYRDVSLRVHDFYLFLNYCDRTRYRPRGSWGGFFRSYLFGIHWFLCSGGGTPGSVVPEVNDGGIEVGPAVGEGVTSPTLGALRETGVVDTVG